MRILFEGYKYDESTIINLGLNKYVDREKISHVGYFFSSTSNDIIFILPQVFLFKDDTTQKIKAFGTFEAEELAENVDLLKTSGFDDSIYELSVWVYQAIEKYRSRIKEKIIDSEELNSIIYNKGDNNISLLDIILELREFNKSHRTLVSFIQRVKSSGSDRINWNRTIKKNVPYIFDGNPYYFENKKNVKGINYEEELIRLFYSVLNYIKSEFHIKTTWELNYNLLASHKIQDLIDTCRGTRYLMSIKNNYFRDDFKLLWNLLYVFFEKSEAIKSGKSKDEAVLAKCFDRIFEDMTDYLIGDEKFKYLKHNEDNKRIDHIYKDDSLIGNKKIFFIGDSKYYYSGNELDDPSLYKQFTYAKNIIQHVINIINSANRTTRDSLTLKDVCYRDELTEGYNMTPNFFIRGKIKKKDISCDGLNLSEINIKENTLQQMPQNYHFKNRPFDRDSLLLHAFDINFLYMLFYYVNDNKDIRKQEEVHSIIREKLLYMYNQHYDFFHVTPYDKNVKKFVKRHINEFYGQMYHEDNQEYVWMAFDKGTMTFNHLQLRFVNEAKVNCHQL